MRVSALLFYTVIDSIEQVQLGFGLHYGWAIEVLRIPSYETPLR